MTAAATIRDAVAPDGPFLVEMLVHAVSWDPSRPAMGRAEVLATPALSHYVDGWPRDGDTGVVAVDDSGVAVGAAWFRFFTAQDPGYGFVVASTPEVSIGVAAATRGQGVGTALLQALHERARSDGLVALSLSVEGANPAARLYRRLGYQVQSSAGGALTMCKVL